MPEWLAERGIGETRLVRLADGQIIEARIMVDGCARAGEVRRATLTRAATPAVATDGGEEFLLPKGARGITEGASLHIEVTREAIGGGEPWKRALARVADDGAQSALAVDAEEVAFPAPDDWLEIAGWSDLLEEARSGVVRLPGGELRVSVTPAMTLIDVDGHLPPAELALAGASAAARTILRHGIGGSIGIDLPTISGKAERQAVAERFDALLPQPFERTAMNGFGFIQIVRPRRYASMFELAQDRAAFEARALLRRVALGPPGPKRLVGHPALVALVQDRPGWTEALARQIGGAVTLRADASLPIHGAYAEKV